MKEKPIKLKKILLEQFEQEWMHINSCVNGTTKKKKKQAKIWAKIMVTQVMEAIKTKSHE